MTQTYDPENIFAKILKGEIPSNKVYEDDLTFAFLDIMPRADGHTLVIPKNPSRNILDVDPADLAAVMTSVQKIARGVMEAFDAEGILIQQFNEPAAGQVVYHLHFHVIPRHSAIKLKPHTGEMADQAVLQANADKLRAVL